MNRFNKHINYICLIVLTLFALSCERDTWLTGMESQGSGDPVNVLLSFEVPQADEVTVTRTMSEQEEHNIRDLYVLIFDAGNGSLVSRQYFDENALNVTKVNHYNGDWKSVLDDNPNSTHGTVMAKALEKNCLIFGVANVKGADSEVGDADQIKATINDGASSTEKSLTSISNLNEFYQLQAHLKDDISLGRVNSHLLMSGVFVPKDRYKPTNYNAYNGKYQQGVAGLVDIGQANVVAELKDENGNVDLTKAGVIRLRRLASHIKFNISVNGDINGNGTIDDDEKVFIDFKPESWRILNAPKSSYLMDQGNEKHKITGEDNFSNPEAQKSMIHADGTYQFDFYMYENFKEARDIHDINATTAPGYPLWSEMSSGNKTIVTTYYQPEFGNSVTDTDISSGNSKKLASLYNNDAHAFKYAKRELALKDDDGTYILSADGTTKQFVYVEPNATYVEIKGRLRFNTENFKLTDLIKRGDVDRTTTQAIKDGYADVTYLVHLGYARKMSIKDEIQGTGTESDDYKMADFNSLRNTEYTYNIEIRGVNSIFTQVVTESPDDTDKRESAKLQTGASGFIGMASQDVYNTDAHFNTFNIFLDIDHLDKDNFYFEINTPWTVIKSTDITDEAYNNSASKYYKFNADLTWIKVRRNYDQTKGDNENFISYVGNNHRSLMPYYKEQKAGVTAEEYESTYHFNANPLIDLYQLHKELENLSDGGLPITIKSGNTVTAYTAKLETESVGGSDVKVLNYYDADNNKAGTLSGLFYTVYLDEYYYNTKPIGASWNVPYWHEFVNRPARYVSFGTKTVGNSATTFDQESSMLKPQLMIVQPSIQSHYATEGDIIVGLGMEHYNETPHPRWDDAGAAGTPGTTFSGDKKKFGWLNAEDYIVNKEKATWDAYVADYVGLYNNVTMKPVANPSTDVKGNGAQYLANAIRLCMNRNRDENGNGKIDKNEMKWYLPSSQQMSIINMCHYSFYDPLLNYNNYLYGTDSDGNIRYRLKKAGADGNDDGYASDFYGRNHYQFHFVTSDYMKLLGEEMMNFESYNTTGNWTTNPGQMRCVRNLGNTDNTSKVELPKAPYFTYNGTAVVVNGNQTETQDNPDSRPDEIFNFVKNGEKKYFVMESYLDKRSIRTAKYVREELPPHYLFSETNRTYKAFQVAQDPVIMSMDDWGVTISGTKYIELKNVVDERNCRSYKDPDELDSEIGTWRAPNAAELSLMIQYLRSKDANGIPNDPNPSMFFAANNGTNPQPFSSTSWNWTGDYWIRVVGIKSIGGGYHRSLYLTDPYRASYNTQGIITSLSRNNYTYDVEGNGNGANLGLRDAVNILLRCVKDVEKSEVPGYQ